MHGSHRVLPEHVMHVPHVSMTSPGLGIGMLKLVSARVQSKPALACWCMLR